MSGKATIKNFKTMLGAAKLPERTVDICLRGDLAAEHKAAEQALVDAQRTTSDSKEGNGVGALIAEVERIQNEMRAATYPFVIRALPRVRFRALMKAHPPREVDGEMDKDDAQVGFNRETFFEALVKVTTVDPEMGVDVEAYFAELLKGNTKAVLADGDWPELFDKIVDSQYGDLTDAAWFVNRDEVSVPFSLAASLAKKPSAAE
jgi:hypothetical protein